jgi:hypothetical protein
MFAAACAARDVSIAGAADGALAGFFALAAFVGAGCFAAASPEVFLSSDCFFAFAIVIVVPSAAILFHSCR